MKYEKIEAFMAGFVSIPFGFIPRLCMYEASVGITSFSKGLKNLPCRSNTTTISCSLFFLPLSMIGFFDLVFSGGCIVISHYAFNLYFSDI